MSISVGIELGNFDATCEGIWEGVSERFPEGLNEGRVDGAYGIEGGKLGDAISLVGELDGSMVTDEEGTPEGTVLGGNEGMLDGGSVITVAGAIVGGADGVSGAMSVQ